MEDQIMYWQKKKKKKLALKIKSIYRPVVEKPNKETT